MFHHPFILRPIQERKHVEPSGTEFLNVDHVNHFVEAVEGHKPKDVEPLDKVMGCDFAEEPFGFHLIIDIGFVFFVTVIFVSPYFVIVLKVLFDFSDA